MAGRAFHVLALRFKDIRRHAVFYLAFTPFFQGLITLQAAGEWLGRGIHL
jgi:hypothetical protein